MADYLRSGNGLVEKGHFVAVEHIRDALSQAFKEMLASD